MLTIQFYFFKDLLMFSKAAAYFLKKFTFAPRKSVFITQRKL
jgi:hypothetical protein